MSAPTREQLISNIHAMEAQGAKPNDIQGYLDSFKGMSPEQPQESPSGGSSTGLMTGPLSLLAVPGQIASKAIAQIGTQGSRDATEKNIQILNNISQRALDIASKETDSAKKRELLEIALRSSQDAGDASRMATELLNEMQKKQKIKTPIGDIPALSNEPLEAGRQIIGRGVQTIALTTPALGATGAGATLGLGESIEKGAGLGETALRTGAYALGGKLLGKGIDIAGGTQIGQKILSSKPMQIIEKALKPFMSKPATSEAGKVVDLAAQKFGEVVDTTLSPSAWIRGGQSVGLLKTPEQKLVQETEKLRQKVRDTLNLNQRQSRAELKSGKSADEIVVREGLPLESYREAGKIKLDTTQAQEIIKVKSEAENRAFDGVLKTSDDTVDLVEYAKDAVARIKERFSGSEQEKALKLFNDEMASWVNQLKDRTIIGVNGEHKVSVYDFNKMKRYFWTKVKGFGSPDAVLSGDLDYLLGNTAKTTLENTITDAEISAMNDYLGDLAYVQRILSQKHGSVVPGGAMGKYFARTIGAIVGAKGGPLGSIGGAMTADKLAEWMLRPEVNSAMAYNAVQALKKQLGVKADTIIEDAYRIIENRAMEKAMRLRLPQPTTIYAGPYKGGESKFINPEILTAEEKMAKGIGGPEANIAEQKAKAEATARGRTIMEEKTRLQKIIQEKKGSGKIGQDAVNFLLNKKGGEIPSAFSHPNLGKIDLIWGKAGEKGYGLAHILEQRPDIVNKLDDIISKGKVIENNGHSAYIESQNGRVAIRLDWQGTPKKWVLTAYKSKK